jgi:hypothetical protein
VALEHHQMEMLVALVVVLGVMVVPHQVLPVVALEQQEDLVNKQTFLDQLLPLSCQVILLTRWDHKDTLVVVVLEQ